MIFITHIRSLLLIAIIFIAICCKSKQKESALSELKTKTIAPSANNSEYSRVEIYCWCFLNTANKSKKHEARLCSTYGTIKPLDLIDPELLFDSISDPNKIKALQNLIFEKKESSEPIRRHVDSRFLILFKKNNFEADTLVKYEFLNQLWYNGQYVFNYSFEVIDSVRSILNMEKIDCKSH